MPGRIGQTRVGNPQSGAPGSKEGVAPGEIGRRGRSGVALLLGAALALASCAAPASHTPEPWASDPERAAALTERAARACRDSGRNGGVQPIRPFVTDGCSRFPDTEWNTRCCVEHDVEYWCGGSAEQRAAADAAFGACVADNAGAFAGWLMETGVRLGGHPTFPSSYRWGYGHPYRAGYPSAGSGD